MPRAPPPSRSCCRRAFSRTSCCRNSQGGPTLASHGAQQDGTGAYVLIRFNPQASVDDISKFLAEHKASIAGGPAAGSGLFRLKVAEKPVGQAELGAIVKRMQGNPVVGFTVPAAQ